MKPPMKAMSTEEFAEYWPRRWEAGLLANDTWDRIALALEQREALLRAAKAVSGTWGAWEPIPEAYELLLQAIARCES